jgi:uncharacterized protein YchJ
MTIRSAEVSVPKDLKIITKPGGKGYTMVRKSKKVYPNQPCTCGSGKKAKKCCYKPYQK